MSVFFDDVDLDAVEQIPAGVMAGLLAARPIRPAPRPAQETDFLVVECAGRILFVATVTGAERITWRDLAATPKDTVAPDSSPAPRS